MRNFLRRYVAFLCPGIFGIDDLIIGATIAAAGSVAGSAISASGARDVAASNAGAALATNDFTAHQAWINREWQRDQANMAMNFNAEQQNNAQAFNANQASLQRQWQEEMSNTAYQRAVGDMTKAGINPMVAYSKGGASTPSGASASGSGASIGIPGGSSAQGVMAHANPNAKAFIGEAMANTASRVASIQETMSRKNLNEAQEEAVRASIPKTQSETALNTASAAEIVERTKVHVQSIKESEERVRNLHQSNETEVQKTFLTHIEGKLAQVRVDLEKQHISESQARARLATLQGDIEAVRFHKEKSKSRVFEVINAVGDGLFRSPGAGENAKNDTPFEWFSKGGHSAGQIWRNHDKPERPPTWDKYHNAIRGFSF